MQLKSVQKKPVTQKWNINVPRSFDLLVEANRMDLVDHGILVSVEDQSRSLDITQILFTDLSALFLIDGLVGITPKDIFH